MLKISSDEIREFRTRNNLSQQDLAEMLGVSWVSVHRWETGKSQPSKLALKHLNNVIGKFVSKPDPNPTEQGQTETEKLYLSLQEARQKLDRVLDIKDYYDVKRDPLYRIRDHKLNIEGDLSANPDDFLYGVKSS